MFSLRKTKYLYGFSKLSRGYHEILHFQMVKNKFAKKDDCKHSIIVELEVEIVFLPKYFVINMKEGDIEELNNDTQKKFLYFGGKTYHRSKPEDITNKLDVERVILLV